MNSSWSFQDLPILLQLEAEMISYCAQDFQPETPGCKHMSKRSHRGWCRQSASLLNIWCKLMMFQESLNCMFAALMKTLLWTVINLVSLEKDFDLGTLAGVILPFMKWIWNLFATFWSDFLFVCIIAAGFERAFGASDTALMQVFWLEDCGGCYGRQG